MATATAAPNAPAACVACVPPATDIADRVYELVSYVRQGRIMDAMTAFYADDTVMQENNNPPTVGLAANLERERAFVASIRRWNAFAADAVAVDEARRKTLVQYRYELETTDGQTLRFDQVAVQTWRDGKIVHEKFYYDTAR